MKSPKSTSDKFRNPYALHAKKRKAGVVRPKKDKRKSGKNKLREIIKEME